MNGFHKFIIFDIFLLGQRTNDFSVDVGSRSHCPFLTLNKGASQAAGTLLKAGERSSVVLPGPHCAGAAAVPCHWGRGARRTEPFFHTRAHTTHHTRHRSRVARAAPGNVRQAPLPQPKGTGLVPHSPGMGFLPAEPTLAIQGPHFHLLLCRLSWGQFYQNKRRVAWVPGLVPGAELGLLRVLMSTHGPSLGPEELETCGVLAEKLSSHQLQRLQPIPPRGPVRLTTRFSLWTPLPPSLGWSPWHGTQRPSRGSGWK